MSNIQKVKCDSPSCGKEVMSREVPINWIKILSDRDIVLVSGGRRRDLGRKLDFCSRECQRDFFNYISR